tara:strand:+ start:74 stop:238 length:165 start_codon:yes stop_codon:yes gene_type:complete
MLCLAIICITILELYAMKSGMNGVALAGATAAIGAIVASTLTYLKAHAKIKAGK